MWYVYFYHLTPYLLNILVSTSQTLAHIESQGLFGPITSQQIMTTSRPLMYVISDIEEFVKCGIKR